MPVSAATITAPFSAVVGVRSPRKAHGQRKALTVATKQNAKKFPFHRAYGLSLELRALRAQITSRAARDKYQKRIHRDS